MKKMIDNIRKYLPAVLLLVLLLFCIRYREDLSVERILSYTPEEPVKAALLMLGLYAVKSVSFIFPIAILQLAVGHLFSTGTALLVNFLGRAVTLALPYWMGRFSGASMVESLTAKYPKLKTVVDYQNGNSLYISHLEPIWQVACLERCRELFSLQYLEQISKIRSLRHSGSPQCFL